MLSAKHTIPPMASSSTSSPLSSPPMSPSPTPSSTHYSLQNPRTHDVFQSIVKGRKSWKTFRGGEVVWPPELEAALIEGAQLSYLNVHQLVKTLFSGLENYQPDDSRETRLLGRFPLRNRFISDWIYEKTGKRRSAKQVGSRLQQLRDTCGAKRSKKLFTVVPCQSINIISNIVRNLLLHPRHISPDVHHKHGTRPTRCESDSGSDSSASAPATPIEAHATLQSLLYRGIEPREELPNNIVYIDLLRPGSSLNVDDQSWTSPSQAAEERSLVERGHNIVRATQHPRLFSDIDPTVTLLAHSRTNARCYFAVHSDNRLIYSESTTLERVDPPTTSNVDGVLYKTSLVPGFWDTISQSSGTCIQTRREGDFIS